MSTAERYAAAAPPAPAETPRLVALAGDRVPRVGPNPGAAKPVNADRLFYGMGYLGVTLIVVAAWAGAIDADAGFVVYPLAALFVGVGGFGVLVHTAWKPNERKVRHLLLAIASLVLAIVSTPVVRGIAREVRAAVMIDRLQPLADALAGDPRIHQVGRDGGRVVLNGYLGPEHGAGGAIRVSQPAELNEVLARDGIAREEVTAYLAALDRAGIREADRTDLFVAFAPTGAADVRLVYVPPGRAIPPPGIALDDHSRWRSKPMGGGWYLVLKGKV
jgi:hypothetical protein